MLLGIALVVLASFAWGFISEGRLWLGAICVLGVVMVIRWMVKIGWSDR
jgi:hypothetical protein